MYIYNLHIINQVGSRFVGHTTQSCLEVMVQRTFISTAVNVEQPYLMGLFQLQFLFTSPIIFLLAFQFCLSIDIVFFFIFIFYQCDRTLSMEEDCQRLLCDTCARYHENYYKHDVFRARNFDNIISTGTFVCTFEGCAQDIPAPQYSQHQRMCPYRRLVCPVCNEGFASISLRSHLLRQHQFNHYQLNYGYLNTGHNISNDKRVCFQRQRGRLCVLHCRRNPLFCLAGASAAASSQASASSSAPANIRLMASLVAAQTLQDCGLYTDPPLPRCTDVARLISFRHITAENFKISVLIDQLFMCYLYLSIR